jgi:hypothetical protein
MSARTYSVTVEIARDETPELDRAVVTVNGHAFRYPYHWEDSLKGLARRAVLENYRVDSIERVEDNSHGRVPRGSFYVTATAY